MEGGPEPTPLWPKGRDLLQTIHGFSCRSPAEEEEVISPWDSLFLTYQTYSEGENNFPVQGFCCDTWWLREEATSVQLHYFYVHIYFYVYTVSACCVEVEKESRE